MVCCFPAVCILLFRRILPSQRCSQPQPPMNEEAEARKEKGNAAFKAKNYQEALGHYSAAISLNPEVAAWYSNRSACFASLRQFDEAMNDALRCLEKDPRFVKGYYRLAIAHEGRNHLKDAIEALDTALLYGANSEIESKRNYLIAKLSQQRSIIGKEVLRLCRLSRWQEVPFFFNRSTMGRVRDQDINDPDYYDDWSDYGFSNTTPARAYTGEADLELRCPETKMTPLLIAVSREAVELIPLFLSRGARTDFAMDIAISYLAPDSIRCLLQYGLTIQKDAFANLVEPHPHLTMSGGSEEHENGLEFLLMAEEKMKRLKNLSRGYSHFQVPEWYDLMISRETSRIIDTFQILIHQGADVNLEFRVGTHNNVTQWSTITQMVWEFFFHDWGGWSKEDSQKYYSILLFLIQNGAYLGKWKEKKERGDDSDSEAVDTTMSVRMKTFG